MLCYLISITICPNFYETLWFRQHISNTFPFYFWFDFFSNFVKIQVQTHHAQPTLDWLAHSLASFIIWPRTELHTHACVCLAIVCMCECVCVWVREINLWCPFLMLVLLPLDCGHKASAAAVVVAATSPKKYATNCLNSPTQISYSVYLVCRCRRLALNAFMSRNFSHVLKLKTFLLPFGRSLSVSLTSLVAASVFIFYLRFGQHTHTHTHTHAHSYEHVFVRLFHSKHFCSFYLRLFCVAK